MDIISIELIEADIIEFEVIKNESGDLLLMPLDPRLQDRDFVIDSEYVVHEDATYSKIKDLEEGSIVYGTSSSLSDGLTISAIYSYNPRN